MDLLTEEKTVYERVWTLLDDPQLLDVYQKFGAAAFRRSCVLERFESFIRKTGFRGGTVVEIGTCKGLTAVILARHFDRVVSIDTHDDPMKHEIVARLGVGNVDFHTVKTNAAKRKLINRLAFDAAFVDGDHAHDTDTDFAAVERCGRVLFHEHWDAQPPVVKKVALLRHLGTVKTEGKFALWIR